MVAPEKQRYMLYNNMMFTVASHLIEVKTGRPFSTFLRERSLGPPDMTSSYLQPSSAIKSGQRDRIAPGHQFDEESGTWDVFDAFDAPEGQGAGSIVTSVADYIEYVQAMLECRHPISASICKALISPRILIDPGDNDLDPFCSPSLYCLGWQTYHYRGHRVVMHEGPIDGFRSSHFFLPDHGFGAVILGNSDGAEQVTWILTRKLIDAALEIPEVDRPDWAALQAQKLAKGKDGDEVSEDEDDDEDEDGVDDDDDDDTDWSQELQQSLPSGRGTAFQSLLSINSLGNTRIQVIVSSRSKQKAKFLLSMRQIEDSPAQYISGTCGPGKMCPRMIH